MKLRFKSLLALSIASMGTANAAPFGDWATGTTTDGNLYAAVVNESQSVLMKVCVSGDSTCIWYLGTQTRCESGGKSPALINSSLGATTVELVCDRQIQLRNTTGLHYRYAILNYDLMDKIAASATGAFGIAVALESGRFAVYRFSSSGGKQAVSTLEEAALRLYRKNNSPAPAANRDSLL
ncbi:hypothetical protein E6A55_31260 [Cupriavidus necator H16]|uniref:Uncharacterized protein n=1 Tax=Cupriavidus necator (strain ATCC 17699 / DSM 428 / KCTC 22496 / NCIMB 10442 / H16 / Stanier 337) TaxID=381666 RepID=A0AAF1D4K3_CUPNH|nr:hypothetical protein [Cupriavidus necator]QCC04945.1 hypothetical protein E6A55_31260 [Cupriavidus necator H16]QQB79632.1 hypothetical protein I6H87_30810 [Cupriavidus necator]WKA43875.1 hypothetical protein QWP09_31290 [Cupriavidus necator]